MTTRHEAQPQTGADREQQVRTIFSEIAPRYDLLNHLLSLNIDRGWRRKAIAMLDWEDRAGGTFLDACAGTCDLSLELATRDGFHGSVVAADFAHPMLVQGISKIAGRGITPVCGDSLRLPFPSNSFAGATVGFGVRNLADLPRGLSDLCRVLEPGARLVILEFTVPRNPVMRMVYMLYFTRILPIVGRVVSGHPWAYTYLPASVREFPDPDGLRTMMEVAGFANVRYRLLTGGIAALHVGTKP